MERSITLKGQTFQFRSIKEILAKANELKSGDVLAGIAAGSDLERIAAKEALSDIPHRRYLLLSRRLHPQASG